MIVAKGAGTASEYQIFNLVLVKVVNTEQRLVIRDKIRHFRKVELCNIKDSHVQHTFKSKIILCL